MLRTLGLLAFTFLVMLHYYDMPESYNTTASGKTIEKLFGPCGDPCVIRNNGGGYIWEFKDAAAEVQLGAKKQIIVAGPCASACAVFADILRDKVCLTPSASFGFHQAFIETEVSLGEREIVIRAYSSPAKYHSEFINLWAQAQGGYPRGNDLLWMPFRVASQHWTTCPSSPFETALKPVPMEWYTPTAYPFPRTVRVPLPRPKPY